MMEIDNDVLSMIPNDYNKASFLFLYSIIQERLDARISSRRISSLLWRETLHLAYSALVAIMEIPVSYDGVLNSGMCAACLILL